jgi:hypothetical protein
MSVTVTGTIEITPWILGWGEAVEVLAPAQLRHKIAAIGEKLAERNRNGRLTKTRLPLEAPSRTPGKPSQP